MDHVSTVSPSHRADNITWSVCECHINLYCDFAGCKGGRAGDQVGKSYVRIHSKILLHDLRCQFGMLRYRCGVLLPEQNFKTVPNQIPLKLLNREFVQTVADPVLSGISFERSHFIHISQVILLADSHVPPRTIQDT